MADNYLAIRRKNDGLWYRAACMNRDGQVSFGKKSRASFFFFLDSAEEEKKHLEEDSIAKMTGQVFEILEVNQCN